MSRYSLAVLFAACATLAMTPARAADGQILITHSKALAGNVTPGDAKGYPVTLTLPGSYTLGSNLSPGKGLDGVVAASADISIDLNGFRISGGPASGGNNARFGIWDLGDRLTVRNGTIGAFQTAAINAPNRPYLIVENMRIINSGYGIDNRNGILARIQFNTVATNRLIGIYCGRSCRVEGNVVSLNGTGITAIFATVLGNTIVSNAGYAIVVAGTSDQAIGFGNNTIVNNNSNGSQNFGPLFALHPNYCAPAC